MTIAPNASTDLIERLFEDLGAAEPAMVHQGAETASQAYDPIEEALRVVTNVVEARTGLVNRRSGPLTSDIAAQIAGTLPEWANGLKAAQSLGPFKDQANRDNWIDIFPIVRHVHLDENPGWCSVHGAPD